MRVISGSARSLRLETIDGLGTRPTTDRIKETLFNMINSYIFNCNFLDLFSGSGAIGIEALSRGASSAYFVENNPKALECIKRNLSSTHLEDGAKVIAADVMTALRRLEDTNIQFDYIFMDPPYDNLLEKQALEFLMNSNLISKDTVIIVEASLNTAFDYLDNTVFEVTKEKKYKTNKHVFISMKEED